MPDSNHQSAGTRTKFKQFIELSGWTETPGASQKAIEFALKFFQDKFKDEVLLKELLDDDAPKSPWFAVSGQKPYSRGAPDLTDPSKLPWAAASGKAVRLTAWMQAINFRYSVSQAWARPDQILKSYRARHAVFKEQPKGNWYTDEFEPKERLALHPQQNVPWFFRVKAPFQYLTSTVSDAASWLRERGAEMGKTSTRNKYFEGGGKQYFVPHPNGLVVLWEPKYVCQYPQSFQAQVVDNGQCVRFVQVAAGVPQTSRWRCGLKVRGANQIPVDTAIATFVNGRYPNEAHGNHAAIYAGQDAAGIWVWHQWTAMPVHKKHLTFKGPEHVDRSNNGDAFSVID